MTLSRRNRVLLLNLPPIMGRFGQFELKEIVSELNRQKGGMELPSG
jgi:hypothetical protein